MANQQTESKRLLSYIIAEWACALKYEHLSPEAIQAAKLFWFDSIGCALGGSQQDDAKILLKHYRAMSAAADSSMAAKGATAFVSGFKTNPVDAAFLNGHMIRAMDYNDIYWKADPCHPSDLIAAPLALCESEGSERQRSDSRHDHCLRNRNASLRNRSAGCARIRLASRHVERVRGAGRGWARAESHARSNGVGDRHQRGAHILSGRGHGGQVDQHEEHGRSVGRSHGRRERVARARRILRSRTHHRWQGRSVCRVQSRAIQRTTGNLRRRRRWSRICRPHRNRTIGFSIAG